MTICACCNEPILIKDAQIVGDGLEVEYWCKACIELFEDGIENSL